MDPMAPLRRRAALPLLAIAAVSLLACDSDSVVASGGDAVCEGYPPVAGSPYVLPYPVGASYSVLTANCDKGHMGTNKYGYDFHMRSGTPLVAMRGGTVVVVGEGFDDRDVGGATSNILVIDHGDGTWSTYFHMTRNGVLVELGDRVARGDLVALSGASGTGTPHVHVHVKSCLETAVFCFSEPFQFVNADPAPEPTGLAPGVTYTALPYDETMGFLETLPPANFPPAEGTETTWSDDAPDARRRGERSSPPSLR
jgi:murein DD-endopeptidase MepM/ murein hydrolase activator NlpD